MRWLPLVLLVACSRPPPPPPPAVMVEYEMHGELGGPAATSRDQPPSVKLKLGHYRDGRAGIGATIDLFSEATENVADIDPALLRFDGEQRIWRLEGHHGGNDRIDYWRDDDHVLLQLFRDGHVVVFVPDPATGIASDGIELVRDGDADPL